VVLKELGPLDIGMLDIITAESTFRKGPLVLDKTIRL
jgi:hypothetical protein